MLTPETARVRHDPGLFYLGVTEVSVAQDFSTWDAGTKVSVPRTLVTGNAVRKFPYGTLRKKEKILLRKFP